MGYREAWKEIRTSLNGAWLEFVYPPICYHCDRLTDAGALLCSECERAVQRYEAPFCLNCRQYLADAPSCRECGKDWWPLFAYADYQGPIRSIVARFKYSGLLAPAGWGAQRLVFQFGERIKALRAECLVPIPLYPAREARRGYNQAHELALRLSELLAIPVNADLLYRLVNRPPQAELDAASRGTNIAGVFDTEERSDQRRKIVLVDDVVTSGATMREAARVMRNAGHDVCAGIAIAHGQ